jgi:protein pelota
LAAYGKKEVSKAVDTGAVEVLLVLDNELRKDREIESLISKTKQTGAEFHVLNSSFEPGQKLDGFGGVAAILRYKI